MNYPQPSLFEPQRSNEPLFRCIVCDLERPTGFDCYTKCQEATCE